jgi:predicted Zn-dependent protease
MKFFRFVLFLAFLSCGLNAEFKRGAVITDARAQKLIEEIIDTLSKSSKRLSNPRIFFIVDPSMNAFATDDGRIFIHTGLIITLENVGQLIGVLAHELGHITGGHSHRLSSEMNGVTAASIIGTVLGGLGALAGGGGAALLGGMMMGQAAQMGTFAHFSQTHEKEADAAAYRMLEAAKISPDGLVEIFELFKKKSRFSEPPYLKTHPSDQERINAIKNFKAQHPFEGSIPANWINEFEAVQAIFMANLSSIQETERKYYRKDNDAAKLAKVIIFGRKGKFKEAFSKLDGLLQTAPNNPYLHELYGQMKLQSGAETEALTYLKKAVALDSSALSIRLLYAQALFTGKNGSSQEALEQLQRIVNDDPDNVLAWLLMVGAYRKLGQDDNADLSHAEAAMRMGDLQLAIQRANRASKSSNPKVKERAKMLLADERFKSNFSE